MTDEPVKAAGDAPDPASDRARIEPSAAGSKPDLLPILYLIGFLALAGGIYYLWQNPPESRLAAQDAGKVETLQSQLTGLRDELARVQQRPAGPSGDDLAKLQQQVTALADKPAPAPPPPTDLQPLTQQVLALSQQVQALPKQGPDLQPLVQRIEAMEKRPSFDPASLDGRFNALTEQSKQASAQVQQLASRNDETDGKLDARLQQTSEQMKQASAQMQQLASRNDETDGKLSQSLGDLQSKLDALDARQKQTAEQINAVAQRAAVAAKLQGAAAALAAGQKLGEIPGAPPALARYASEAPPTEASLRESFDRYAAEAQRASQPALTDNQGFADRLWSRAQQSVTVRQGDRVLLGDPIAGVIAHAREQLENGDLAGSVESLKGLAGPAAKAMQPWVERAHGLAEARAAIASMASN